MAAEGPGNRWAPTALLVDGIARGHICLQSCWSCNCGTAIPISVDKVISPARHWPKGGIVMTGAMTVPPTVTPFNCMTPEQWRLLATHFEPAEVRYMATGIGRARSC